MRHVGQLGGLSFTRGWQPDRENGPPVWIISDRDQPTSPLNQRLTDREAQTCAFARFSCEKRVKYGAQYLHWNTGAAIMHVKRGTAAPVLCFRKNAEDQGAVALHCLQSIDNQIDHDLLQFAGINCDIGGWGEFAHDVGLTLTNAIANKDQTVLDNCIQ